MMSAQTVSQTPSILRQFIVHYWRIGALGLLIIIGAALVAYRFTNVPAAPAPRVDRLVEPVAQNVIDYLRAPRSVQPLLTAAISLEPAQQSVLSYLRVHESVEQSAAPWDPAVQAALGYLRAHSR